ncbi:VirD4-like conjugal transfer protein, CD1115 family [Cytobacillus kochii]|uniref:VirD4-like conjugal transfer protein, CD1115 family n=1 Tax=Cytobacillus kochii TaxID=859143 RepID=UPI002480D234|nr:type IV secretory system conjugative DNA transfer family protein [Cytobacillus kochii]
MHKEHKQWEKIFANKFVLLFFFIAIFSFGTFILNFLLNLYINIPDILATLTSFSLENPTTPLSIFSLGWFFKLRFEYWFVYLLVFIFLGAVSSIKAYNIHKAFHDINKGTKGTNRFSTLDEIKMIYHFVKDDDLEYKGKSGIPVTHYEDCLFIDTNNTHALVTASTQSGKTEMFSYPLLDLIMRAEEKDSVIITDIKGDMLKNTKHEFENRGYDVHVLNILDPYLSIGYNPLELVKQAYIKGDYAKAQMLCNTLSYSLFHNPNAKDPMWEKSSIALVNALILAVCDICLKNNTPEKITMYTVTVMLSELGSNPDEDGYTKLDFFFGSLPPNNPAKLQYATIQFSQGVTRSGIFTGTMAELKNYTYDTIAKMTSHNTFNIEDLGYGEKPIALFIVYPDWDDSNYTIISTFLSQVAAVLSEKATLSRKGELPRRVRHLFEEVANIPPIEGLDRSLAVGLSRGLLYCLVIQNTAQLEDKYGEKMAESIIGNCGNQIYIMSDDIKDAEEFSKKLGVKTIVTSDRSGGSLSTDKSYNEKEEERPLLMPDELRRLKKGEWVLLRTKKRETKEGERVHAYPIFSSIDTGTQMKHRYEYLMHRFNRKLLFNELNIEGSHVNLDLNELLIKFSFEQENEVPPDMKNPMDNEITPMEFEVPVLEDEIPPEIPFKEFEEGDEEFFMNEVEPVFEESTPILEAITEDKYKFIKLVVKKSLSESEYSYFEGLETIEELRTYFSSHEKESLFKQVQQFLA